MRWSSGPVSVAKRDTTYAFPEKGTGGAVAVPFMKSILKHVLCTLVDAQGLRDDAMDCIRIFAMQQKFPQVPNAIFVDDVRAPREDGVPVNGAKEL